MTQPTTDYPGLNAACTAALAAIETQDFLTARSKVLEAQVIVLYLGNSASANGAQLQLSIDTVDAVLDNLTKLEAYVAAKTTNGRTVRVGLFNGGRRGSVGGYGGYGGVFHD